MIILLHCIFLERKCIVINNVFVSLHVQQAGASPKFIFKYASFVHILVDLTIIHHCSYTYFRTSQPFVSRLAATLRSLRENFTIHLKTSRIVSIDLCVVMQQSATLLNIYKRRVYGAMKIGINNHDNVVVVVVVCILVLNLLNLPLSSFCCRQRGGCNKKHRMLLNSILHVLTYFHCVVVEVWHECRARGSGLYL